MKIVRLALLTSALSLAVACGSDPTSPDAGQENTGAGVDYRSLGSGDGGTNGNPARGEANTPGTTDREETSQMPEQTSADVIARDALPTTEEAWKAHLAKTLPEADNEKIDLAYEVTRNAGTERAFTGIYWDSKAKGVYRCRCCNQKLFESSTKFNSGTGWPSFWAPASKSAVKEKRDTTYGMIRVEVLCGNCDAHLGHVFDDGPAPTGQRYCMNSISLKLAEKK